MIRDLASIDQAYDIAVVGAGAAGMAAALFAAIENRKVLLVERTEYLGGTSALSAATTWIPNSDHASDVPGDDSPEAAETFLTGVVGNYGDHAMLRAFLEAGPAAIRLLEAQSEVKFRPYATHPDYEQQFEGATLRGRALEPLPFDGRLLGAHLDRIRPPIPEFTIFGGMMVDRTDINHLLKLKQEWTSFRHAYRVLARYGADRLSGHKRGSRLVMGNALIGRMLKSLLDRDADIVLATETTGLITLDGTVTGLTLSSNGISRAITAKSGVVLAAGGFNRHPQRRDAMLPVDAARHSPAAPGHTGAMQDHALALGARFGEGGLDNAFWAPVSIRTRADGSTAVFPHFVMDRSKPGTICVNQQGQRFTNESASYHLFARAMIDAHKTMPTIPAVIIADAPALRRYGLGMVRMGTKNITSYLADGYLVEAATLEALGDKLGIDGKRLQATVTRFNSFSASGVDPDFGRGTTAYHRVNGDATFPGPNPTLGRIETGPFYAVRLWPGDIGAATGLVISPDAQVLGDKDIPIPGLYACGNEAQSIMGGTYPGPGITIGPAITFAYRAIRHALAKPHQQALDDR
jgi:succinate dehydrogenase/fumarate reductase flavoprotein subunit